MRDVAKTRKRRCCAIQEFNQKLKNGASRTNDIEGKSARVAATERGSEGVSLQENFLSNDMLVATSLHEHDG